MTPLVVCDASSVVALLLDDGSDGRWAAGSLAGSTLAAPGLLPFEVANVVRRQETAGRIGPDQAAQAHDDLRDLPVDLWPYELLAGRVWELRANLTAYDASYVALAELLDATLVTLDRRIAGVPGLRCPVSVPPGAVTAGGAGA